jgi:site-specific recombinase XerD
MAASTLLQTRPEPRSLLAATGATLHAPVPRLPFDASDAGGHLARRVPTLGCIHGVPVLSAFVALAVSVAERPDVVNVDDAITAALRMVDETALITTTTTKYTSMWVKFGRYCRQRGVVTIDQVTADLVGDWVRTLTRRGKYPAVSTSRGRRTAITKLYELLRSMGVTQLDPARDVELDRRPAVSYRGMTEDEIARGRAASLHTLIETRLPTIWALAEAGATPSEIPSTTAADVDLDAGTVWLAGLDAAVPRKALLSEWGRTQLARRVASAQDEHASLTYAGAGPIETAQVATSLALRKILDRAGLSGLEGIGPRSLRITYGLAAYAVDRRIEDAADALGIRSLDQTVSLLGIEWGLREA